MHQITAAAADAAAPLILDRLKQADRRQAVYIPIQAINAHIQAEKKLKQTADARQTKERQQTAEKTAHRIAFYCL